MDQERIWIVGMICVWLLMLSPVFGFADSLSDETVSQRIAFIQERLDQGTKAAKSWQYSWMMINGTASYLQFGIATTQDEGDEKHDRYDNVVGGITGLLAVGDLMVNPLVAWSAGDKLRMLHDSTPEERMEKLKQGKRLLKACADREEYGRSWKTHALSGLVNALAGVAITLDDSRGSDGFFAFASGMLVSEIQIFTMPTRAITDWDDYSKLSSGAMAFREKFAWRNRFFITANSRSLRCTILF